MRGVWVQPLRRERARPLHGRCTAVRNLPRPYNHGHHGPRRRTHGEACGHAKFLLKSLLILIGVRLHLLWSNIARLAASRVGESDVCSISGGGDSRSDVKTPLKCGKRAIPIAHPSQKLTNRKMLKHSLLHDGVQGESGRGVAV
eukprot:1656115-Prymnesium_polylepis.1